MLIAMRIFQLVLLVCLICHWMACLWHMACSATDDCSSSYDDLRAVDVYLQAYYTATLALMGDHIYVDSRAQQIMVICLTLFGSFMLAVVFGSVANMVNQLNLKEVYHQSKVDSLNDVMRYLDLPKNIQERIRQHQEYAWMRYRDVEGGIEGFAKPLPESLQQEVLLNFHTTVLNKVTFFVALPQNAQIALVSKLTSKTAIPGEVILKKGEPARGLFLLSRGCCEVLLVQTREAAPAPSASASVPAAVARIGRRLSLTSSPTVSDKPNPDIKYLPRHAGSVFGERSLMTGDPVGATVLATTFCDMHHLSRESFSSLVVDFPEILHGLQSYHKHEIDPAIQFKDTAMANKKSRSPAVTPNVTHVSDFDGTRNPELSARSEISLLRKTMETFIAEFGEKMKNQSKQESKINHLLEQMKEMSTKHAVSRSHTNARDVSRDGTPLTIVDAV
ncbi:hypothetical protein CYMTET_18441 [Cymbomonas tetramitiformis]|uniref:Cyclic nucleotide-binding domain-containing protein n=1 Tax=Cymbomonas tetramitiformis TaxID=36881 RepID=A0AAE0G805_9CHLO|nr:hypothetical protein CYMTET_18441 [Cymbomonas tetramitiformis]